MSDLPLKQVMVHRDNLAAALELANEELARFDEWLRSFQEQDSDGPVVDLSEEKIRGPHINRRRPTTRRIYDAPIANLIVNAMLKADPAMYTSEEIADMVAVTTPNIHRPSVGGNMARLTRAGLVTCYKYPRRGNRGAVPKRWEINREAAMRVRNVTLYTRTIDSMIARRAS